jgi:LacI family transcriptional regulator
MTEPSLTTVHQDITAKGENAVRMIIQAAAGGVQDKQEMILPIEIVERESVLDLNRGNA